MKLAVIYSDKRGPYIADGFRNFCEVIEIDLSDVGLSFMQRILSAGISFHFKRSDWVNDFHRNPLVVFFRKKMGDKIISGVGKRVDAVFQFGVMNTYDYSLLGTDKVFYYLDGAYDKYSQLWTIKRYEKWFSLMQKKAFDDATGIFTFSQWAKNQIIDEYAQNAQKVLASGWGPCLPVDGERVPLRKNVQHFLFIGKPGKWKGLHILVSAFKKLKATYSEIVLDVVGVDSQDASNLAGEGIFFHGRQPQDDVIGFLKKADVFILPSLYERAGHVTIEAMWYGCPVVVTETCGASEPVNACKCGWTVEPGNTDALYCVIKDMIEKNDSISQLSYNAMFESRKKWSWFSVCERMFRHITSAAGVQ